MQTYIFQVELEPDEDGWHIFYAPWRKIGASTWGRTKEEAMQNIREVLEIILEEFESEGKPVSTSDTLTVREDATVTVSR